MSHPIFDETRPCAANDDNGEEVNDGSNDDDGDENKVITAMVILSTTRVHQVGPCGRQNTKL